MLPVTPELRKQVTAVILSGGLGRRMGGQDKGLISLAGRPMISHVLERIHPQAHTILINANRHIQEYEKLGLKVISDQLEGFQGPLAGIASALTFATSPFLLVCPCDSPRVPTDLCQRLYSVLLEKEAEIAIVHDGHRFHPVFSLIRRELRPSLESYLGTGNRKFEDWFKSQHFAIADCSDIADSFVNINRPDTLQLLENEHPP